MSTAPFDPRFDPHRKDSQGLIRTAICLLCIAVFFLLARGCSSSARAPWHRYEVALDLILHPLIARSN